MPVVSFGVDFAWGTPDIAELKRRDVEFVMRYFSHDSSKDLDIREVTKFTEADIWIGVVWETTANRALSGYSGGVNDATDALELARVCHMPDERPIYFAVDWDATSGQQSAINSYLDGAASVLGRERIGLYAGYWPLKRAFDAKKITWGWQTYAWSGGKWDNRAHLQQYSNGHILGGVDCDYNRAMVEDFGQWQLGKVPMALSTSDKEWLNDWGDKLVEAIRVAVWEKDAIPAPDSAADPANPNWRARNVIRESYDLLNEILKKLGGNTP